MVGSILWYGLRTDWRALYANLDPADARQIGTRKAFVDVADSSAA